MNLPDTLNLPSAHHSHGGSSELVAFHAKNLLSLDYSVFNQSQGNIARPADAA